MSQGVEGVFSGVMPLSRINEWVHCTRADSALSLDETHPGYREVRQQQARVEASSMRRDMCSSTRARRPAERRGADMVSGGSWQPPVRKTNDPRAGLSVLQRCLPSRLQARQPGRGFSPCSGAESRSEVGRFAHRPGAA